VYRENLEAIHKTLAEAQTVHRRGDGRAEAKRVPQVAVEGSSGLQKELDEIGAKLEKAKRGLALLAKKNATRDEKVPDYLIDAELDKEPQTFQLCSRREKLKRTVAAYEKYARDGPDVSPLVTSSLRAYRADLQAADRQLEKRRGEVRERLQKQLREANLQTAQLSRKQLDEQIALLLEEDKVIRQRLGAQANDVTKSPRNSWVELERLLNDIERRQEVVKSFGKQCEALRREIAAGPRVILVQEAAAPQ
jgi:hypothetical protein